MAYPSTTLTRNKLPTGTAGIGFYDLDYPDGDRPVDTYDLGGGITMIVEQGSANGAYMAIELAESVPWRFGSSPEKIACIGFGKGPMYTQAVDSVLNTHTDPITGNQILFGNANWVVKQAANGRRYVQATNVEGAGIFFDTGITRDDIWARFSSQAEYISIGGNKTQLKFYRLNQNGPDNSTGGHYNQIYANFLGGASAPTVQAPANNAGDNAVGISATQRIAPYLDEGWSLYNFTAYSGHTEQSDGLIFSGDYKRGGSSLRGGFFNSYSGWDSTNGTQCPLISDTFSTGKRWRWMSDQSFHSDSLPATFRKSDWIMQVGSAVGLIVSSTNSLTGSADRFELPPLKIENNGRRCLSIFWPGYTDSLMGKYMFYVDAEQVPTPEAVVASFQISAV